MRTRTNRSDRAHARSSFNLSNWLLKTLNGSKIGLAIYDKGFHYVGVNSAIAIMNGVPPEEHLGQTAPEVIGRTARIIEARIDRVFLTGQPVYQHEFSAKLPMRTDIGYWVQDYFPIGDERDRVSHVGIFVIEVTQHRRLEGIIRHLRASITSGDTIDRRRELLALIHAAQRQRTPVKAPTTHESICKRPWRGFYLAHPTWMGKIEWFRRHLYRSDAVRCEDQELLLRCYEQSRFAAVSETVLGYREEELSLAKILTSRRHFTAAVLLRAARKRQYFVVSATLIEQLLKGLVDCIAIGTGLNHRLLRHRALAVDEATAGRWNDVWAETQIDQPAVGFSTVCNLHVPSS
jgi:PAS domain-containing protein